MLVPPKGGLRVNPKTIHIPGFKLTEECQELCKKIVSSGFSILAAYAPADIALKLGYAFKPMFSSGPNTYKDPQKESKLSTGELCGSSKLTVYHTLPVDATALLTLFKPEDLSVLGSLWFSDREIYPISGYDNPIEPVREGLVVVK